MRVLLESSWQNPVSGLSLEFLKQDMPGALQFRLASPDLDDWMDVSVVPAFDALGEGRLARSRAVARSLGVRQG